MNTYPPSLTAESLQDHLDDAALLAPDTPIMIVLTAEDLQALADMPRGFGVTLPLFPDHTPDPRYKSVRLPPTELLQKMADATARVLAKRKG